MIHIKDRHILQKTPPIRLRNGCQRAGPTSFAGGTVIARDCATEMTKEIPMIAKPSPDSRRDDIISAVGLLTLVISAATGNALVMLATSAVALAAIAVVYQGKIGRMAWVVAGAAMVFASALAVAISHF
jgi:hypothetical protein